MKIEVSDGDIVDKLTILEIKLEKITDKEKRQNVIIEYNTIEQDSKILLSIPEVLTLKTKLKNINYELWKVEDALRIHEKESKFDATFISLARSVYHLNDERANIKKQINKSTNSKIIEEKDYVKYG